MEKSTKRSTRKETRDVAPPATQKGRRKFKAPVIKVHKDLPVVTAGSVNLW